jgi:hypothetical protein
LALPSGIRAERAQLDAFTPNGAGHGHKAITNGTFEQIAPQWCRAIWGGISAPTTERSEVIDKINRDTTVLTLRYASPLKGTRRPRIEERVSAEEEAGIGCTRRVVETGRAHRHHQGVRGGVVWQLPGLPVMLVQIGTRGCVEASSRGLGGHVPIPCDMVRNAGKRWVWGAATREPVRGVRCAC